MTVLKAFWDDLMAMLSASATGDAEVTRRQGRAGKHGGE